jgi:hypothetical protein
VPGRVRAHLLNSIASALLPDVAAIPPRAVLRAHVQRAPGTHRTVEQDPKRADRG